MAGDDLKTLHADRALELMMRDSLEGMADFATMFGYRPWPGEFEIISIESPAAECADDQVVWLKTGTTH
jgi:hypothetical protein